jgi:hypothetical protein
MEFYVGLHHPSDAHRFERAFVSVNRLRDRKSDFEVGRWIMDSGAFTEVSRYGGYRHPVSEYADQIRRWARCGTLEAAVAQDYMCEPWIVERTGLSVEEHQRLTIERYDALVAEDLPVPVMPVLQGYHPTDYLRHLLAYGNRLRPGMWVGVGSVCKRNSRSDQVAEILRSIKRQRPDLRLHGFGLKQTALADYDIREALYSSDSTAWSFAARYAGRNANDWREAKAFEAQVEQALGRESQMRLNLF